MNTRFLLFSHDVPEISHDFKPYYIYAPTRYVTTVCILYTHLSVFYTCIYSVYVKRSIPMGVLMCANLFRKYHSVSPPPHTTTTRRQFGILMQHARWWKKTTSINNRFGVFFLFLFLFFCFLNRERNEIFSLRFPLYRVSVGAFIPIYCILFLLQ